MTTNELAESPSPGSSGRVAAGARAKYRALPYPGLRQAGESAMFGILIGIISWPVAESPPSIQIDPSWIVALHLAARLGLHFGSDILFTYGPLGFLGYPQPYLAWTSAFALLFVGSLHCCLCAVLFHLARQRLGRVLSVGLVLATAFAFSWLEGWPTFELLVVLGGISAVMRRPEHQTHLLYAVMVGVAIAVGALAKFNVAIVCFIVGVVSVITTARSVSRSLAAMLGAAIFTFLLLWIASGQRPTDIAEYLRGAMEVTVGYAASMGMVDPALPLTSGLAAATTLVVAGLAWRSGLHLDRGARVAAWIVLASYAFVAFKTGFTRAGAGVTIYAVAVTALWPRLVPRESGRVEATLPVVGLIALISALSGTPLQAMANPVGRLQAFAHEASAAITSRSASAADTAAVLRAEAALPSNAVQLLAGQTVDIHPWQTALAYGYPELRWTPEPIFQDYAAYTPYLDQVDAQFLASPAGPSRMLWLTQPTESLSIDGRSMWFDSPGAKIEMLCRYVPVGGSETWQVLQRVPDRCGPPTSVESIQVLANQTFAVPRPSTSGVVAIRVTGMGADVVSFITNLAFRAPDWWFSTATSRFKVPLGINGQWVVIGATADTGYASVMAPGAPPDRISIGPTTGSAGDGTPLTVQFEVIPLAPR